MPSIRAWVRRLMGVVGLGRADADLQDELRLHAEFSHEDGRPAIGAAQSMDALRDQRGLPWLEDLSRDVRHALRMLRRNPGFVAIAITTLALGSGAATVMFAVVNGVLLKPLAYPSPGQLMSVHDWTDRGGEQVWFAYLNFRDLEQDSHAFAPAAWRYGGGTISEPGEAEYVDGLQISSGFFAVLGAPMTAGREFRSDEDRPGGAAVAVISRALWNRRYASRSDVVGTRLVFDGQARTIVGIAPPAAPPVAGYMAVFTPLGQNAAPFMRSREAHPGIRVVARLAAGSTPASANAELALISRDLAEQYPSTNGHRWFTAQPLARDVVGGVRSTLWLLLGAVGLVLLVACVNVASLLLARVLSREREWTMRAALGASRIRLIRQCLTESALLGLTGGLLGIGLAAIGVRPFVALWPGELPRVGDVQIDWRVLFVAIGVSVACGLLFGLAPAVRVPSRDLDRALPGGARSTDGGSRRLHGGLVAVEIALAIVLLVAAGMLGRTILGLSAADPGLNVRHVLAGRVALSPGSLGRAASIRTAWQDILERARRVPGVQAAALADIVPMRAGENAGPYSTTPAPASNDRLPVALMSTVTPDYLRVMGIPLRRGRFFDEHDRLDTAPVVVIDEVLARHAFGDRNPVGERLWVAAMGPAPLRIVGEVGHVRHWGPARDDDASIRDQMYYPFAQVPDALMRPFSAFMSLTVRTSAEPSSVVEPLRREMRGPANDQALYEVRTMEQLASASLARQRFLLWLFGVFAALALLLACIGIYGVLAYLTQRRVPELGVRMALGATAGNVMRLVFRQSLGMIAVGVIVGTVAAFAASRLLARLVDGVQPADLSVFLVVIACLVAAALVAGFVPARRASRLDALKALRQA